MMAIYLAQEAAAPKQTDRESSASTTSSASSQSTSFRQQSQSNQRKRMVPLDQTYLASAQSYLKTALKLYSTHGQGSTSAPAVSYVKQLLRWVSSHSPDSFEVLLTIDVWLQLPGSDLGFSDDSEQTDSDTPESEDVADGDSDTTERLTQRPRLDMSDSDSDAEVRGSLMSQLAL